MSSKPILYYSRRCKFCTQVLDKLHKNDMLTTVTLLDIDTHAFPESIKKVPTLHGSAFNKPLVGKKVFEWIDTVRYFNNSSNNIRVVNKVVTPRDSELLTRKGAVEDEKKSFCDVEQSTKLLL